MERFEIPISRSSSIICFYGPPGSGKTIAMSYFGLYYLLKGKKIVSNYHLLYPHTYVDSLDALDECYDSVGLFDDFEFLGSSKFLKNSEKKDLLQISLMFSKRLINPVLYSIKRPMECDKTLRSLTTTFVKCSLELKNMPGCLEEYEYMSRYLDAHHIKMEVYDADNFEVPEKITYLDDLDVYCNLYDTHEEVKKLGVSAANNGRDGQQ